MEQLLKTVEKFLTYSDEKLEELSEKNQKVRQDIILKVDKNK